MHAYIARRLLATVPVLLLVALFTFGLLHFTPGDPAAIIAGDYATPEDVAKIRQHLGLDRPLHERIGIWFAQLARGDLGKSVFSGIPVTTLIKDRLPPTLGLTLMAEVFAISLAVPLGVLAAWKANTWVDRAVMVFAVVGFSMPVFWLGFLLMKALAIEVPIFPPAGYRSISQYGLPAYLRYLTLPAITLGLVYMALIARMTRASMLEILREDYIRTAYAKGLSQWVVLVRHALKNASLPVVTIIGLGLATLLGGVVVTESVFAIPGVGRLIVDAILRRDYPVIQGAILLVSVVYVLVNLVVDVAYAYLDPRIRY